MASNTLGCIVGAGIYCPKLQDNNRFTQFHNKFWGKSIEEEAKAWQNSQGPEGLRKLGLQDVSGELLDMNVDSDPDDVLSGCYVLDLSFMGSSVDQHVWVRADYIRMYDACAEEGTGHSGRIVITGQPGIGKTVWLFYAARRRAGEGKPFVWRVGEKNLLFVAEGVFDLQDWLGLRQVVWMFMDGVSGHPGPPLDVIDHLVPFFFIYTTPPKQSRWKGMQSTGSADFCLYVMQPWSRGELRRAFCLELFPNSSSEDAMMDVVERYGPIPRLVNSRDLKYYHAGVSNAIKQVRPEKLGNLVLDVWTLDMDDVSDKLFLVSREDRHDARSQSIVSEISTFVKSWLAPCFRNLQHEDQFRVYTFLASNPCTAKAAGSVYEANLVEQLVLGLDLEIVPIIKPTHGNSTAWRSACHGSLDDAALDQQRETALGNKRALRVHPSAFEEYSTLPDLPLKENVYYMPKMEARVAIYSFIILSGVLHFFQWTVAGEHDINKQLIQFGKDIRYPSVDAWKFVFVTSLQSPLTVLRPVEKLRGLDLYVTTAEVKDHF